MANKLKQLTDNELKQCQLDILSAVHNYCQKNNLRYSLTYGTLLGAVRHKGYIPWDDDIDIMMPRKDYDRFIQNFKDTRYKVIDSILDKDYIIPFAKVYDLNTIIIENSNNKVCMGVNIDIFPIDNFPNDYNEAKSFLKSKKKWDNIHTIKIIRHTRNRPILKSVILAFGKFVFSPWTLKYVTKKIAENARKYNSELTDYKGIISITDGSMKERMPKEVFETIISVPFEDRKADVISSYDKFLTSIYGEYMELPPEEKRITHHAFKAYWK